jgi:hypothetical protein
LLRSLRVLLSPSPEHGVGQLVEGDPGLDVRFLLGEDHDLTDGDIFENEGAVTTCDGGEVISPRATVG